MTSEAPLTILLIDDNPVDRRAVRRAFHRLGSAPAIEEAADSREAYQRLSAQSFDCILLADDLPDADGPALVRALRQRGLDTPIIVLTGQGDAQIVGELMQAGATDCLARQSLAPGQLGHRIRTAIRLQRTEREAAQLRKEGLARLRFLSDLSHAMAPSLDRGQLIERALALLTPSVADWCAIDMLQPDDSLQRHPAHAPDTSGWAAGAADCWPPGPLGPVAAVVRRRAALVYPALPHGDPAGPTPPHSDPAERRVCPATPHGNLIDPAATPHGDLAERLAAHAVGAALCLPIGSGERVFGGLTLARRAPGSYSAIEIALAHQIGERIGAALEGARLYQQAHEATQLRDDFLAIASHELRTPLTSMLGYVQLLERDLRRSYSLEAREERALRTVVDQTIRIKKLISAMLDTSRLQHGQLSLAPEALDLRRVVEQAVAEIQPTLARHQIRLAGAERELPIVGDVIRLQQLLLNLLSNAVQYSPQGGPIAVRLDRQGGWASVAVSDQGIGIPPQSLGRLFTRFFRAPNASEHCIGGVGLGLYVVHEVALLHGGAVEVASELGAGSTFTVRLPLAHP